MLFLLPSWFVCLSSLCFGLVVGSFINVVVARMPRRESIVRPRSRCPRCLSPILARDNVPVLSYLWLRGRCRRCQAGISVRYPLIELLTALLFWAAAVHSGFGPLLWIREWPMIAILIAVTFIDLEHRIIPDKLSLGGLVWGLSTSFLLLFWEGATADPWSAFFGAGLGFGLFYSLAWAYQKSAGRSGLGGGDIKLLAMIGAFLGPLGVFHVILISSVLGTVVGVSLALAQRQKNLMALAIPYGPFLVIGALYYYLLSDFLWFQFMIPT